MRVLHVTATYYPATAYGGPVSSLRQLAEAQVALGASVRVATTDADGPQRIPYRSASWRGVDVAYKRAVPRNSYGVSPGLWRELWTDVRQFDVMHMHGVFLPSTTIGLWACRWSGIPSVVSPHGALMRWARERHRWRKRMYGLLDQRQLAASLLHAGSEEEANDLRDLGFRHVAVIPNGVDHAYFGARSALDIRSHLGLVQQAVIVTWIGRFHEVKNLEILIDATRDLGIELVLAGDSDTTYARMLRERAWQQGRSDVHFVGYIESDIKRALLQQSDAYAQPSLMESYGMSIAEALACGCPVIASTGTPWAILDERGAGSWVPPTVSSFRRAIVAVISSRASRAGQRGAALALASEHDWLRTASAVLDAYRVFRSGRIT